MAETNQKPHRLLQSVRVWIWKLVKLLVTNELAGLLLGWLALARIISLSWFRSLDPTLQAVIIGVSVVVGIGLFLLLLVGRILRFVRNRRWRFQHILFQQCLTDTPHRCSHCEASFQLSYGAWDNEINAPFPLAKCPQCGTVDSLGQIRRNALRRVPKIEAEDWLRLAAKKAKEGKEAPAAPVQPPSRGPVVFAPPPNEITSKIEAFPFLQREDAAKHYVGLSVDWRGKVVRMEDASRGRHMFLVRSGPDVLADSFWVVVPDSPGVRWITDDADVRVTGVICHVSPKGTATVEPAQMALADSEEQRPRLPSVQVRVERKGQAAYLMVTNTGQSADFWANLEVLGLLVDLPQHEIFARWDHTEKSRTLIAAGETHRLRLARLQGSPLIGTWYVPYSSNDKEGEARSIYSFIDDSSHADTVMISAITLTIKLFSQPDLGEGPVTRTIRLRGGRVLEHGAET